MNGESTDKEGERETWRKIKRRGETIETGGRWKEGDRLRHVQRDNEAQKEDRERRARSS